MLTAALAVLLLSAGFLGAQTRLTGLLIWGAVWEIARSACVSLADKGAMDLCGARGGNYGGLRCFGSIGFLAGGMAMGFAAQRWALRRVLFPAYLMLLAVGTALSFAFHQQERTPWSAGGGLRGLGGLFRLPAFRLALLLGVQGSVAVNALQPYLGSHLVSTLGAGEAFLSWNTLFCVTPELLLLPLVSGRLLPRLGFCRTCMATALALVLRCAVYALAPTPQVFVAGSLLYGLSVCGYTAVNLALLKRAVPEERYAAAVLVNAGAAALGRAFFSWLFGVMYQRLGSASIFWLLSALALGVSAVIWRAGKRKLFPELS